VQRKTVASGEVAPGGTVAPGRYRDGRRREPVQRRSRARVERALDAAAELADELGPEVVTTSLIAERAGVSVSWLYDYFDDRQAIFSAVVLRYIADFATLIDRTYERQVFESWAQQVDAVIDEFVELYRTAVGFRALWFSPMLDVALLDANRVNDVALAEQAVRRLREHGLVPAELDLDLPMQVVTALVDKGLDVAFRRCPEGDPEVIEETKRAMRAYLGLYLD